MITPRPIFAKTIKPDNPPRSTRIAASHYHFQGAYYDADPIHQPDKPTRKRPPDYDYDRRCTGCGKVPKCCECDEQDAQNYRERHGL